MTTPIPMFPEKPEGPYWPESQIDAHATAKAERWTHAGNLRLIDRRKTWQKEAINFSFDKTGAVATIRSQTSAIWQRRASMYLDVEEVTA